MEPIRTYYITGELRQEKWLNEKNRPHRKDGPALLLYWENGNVCSEEWYYEGRLSRFDGPAWINYNKDGSIHLQEWFVNGCEIPGPIPENPLQALVFLMQNENDWRFSLSGTVMKWILSKGISRKKINAAFQMAKAAREIV